MRGGFGVIQNRPSLLDPLEPLGSIRAQWNHVATSMDQDGARPTTGQDTKIYQDFQMIVSAIPELRFLFLCLM